MSVPRESKIESAFTKRVEGAGGLALKFTSPGRRGVPDRLVLLRGRAVFVEFKRPGGVVQPWQAHTHDLLRAPGVAAEVRIVSSPAESEALLGELLGAS